MQIDIQLLCCKYMYVFAPLQWYIKFLNGSPVTSGWARGSGLSFAMDGFGFGQPAVPSRFGLI